MTDNIFIQEKSEPKNTIVKSQILSKKNLLRLTVLQSAWEKLMSDAKYVFKREKARNMFCRLYFLLVYLESQKINAVLRENLKKLLSTKDTKSISAALNSLNQLNYIKLDKNDWAKSLKHNIEVKISGGEPVGFKPFKFSINNLNLNSNNNLKVIILDYNFINSIFNIHSTSQPLHSTHFSCVDMDIKDSNTNTCAKFGGFGFGKVGVSEKKINIKTMISKKRKIHYKDPEKGKVKGNYTYATEVKYVEEEIGYAELENRLGYKPWISDYAALEYPSDKWNANKNIIKFSSGRFYNMFHQVEKENRSNFTYNGSNLVEVFDLHSSVFALLIPIFRSLNINNEELDEYTELVRSGQFYEYFAKQLAPDWLKIMPVSCRYEFKSKLNAFRNSSRDQAHNNYADVAELFDNKFPNIAEALYMIPKSGTNSMQNMYNEIETYVFSQVCFWLNETYNVNPFTLHDAIYMSCEEVKLLPENIAEILTKKVYDEILLSVELHAKTVMNTNGSFYYVISAFDSGKGNRDDI